jgi:predicted ATPase/class 3 adenylate cyclase
VAVPSGIVTFLFTDIEGSTGLWESAPEAMQVALRRHDELLRSVIESARGYVFKTVGDAFCAAFTSARDAVVSAGAAQRALQTELWPDQARLRVRMALHTGECEERDGDYFGPTVNRAARLEATAHGGQVVLSEATAVLVRDHLPDHLELIDLGSHRLKDLGRPEQVFGLQVDGLLADFPPLRSLDNPLLPNNLPAQSNRFIGRTREVIEIRILAEEHRLVTLTGAGGSGKTRLALQVAAELLDGSGDGVWLVELAPVADPSMVAATMNEVLGVTGQPGRPEFDALVNALEDQRILIVLDNCEHVIDACAKAADTILRRCPQAHLMTTSREPLGIGGEAIYRVPSLSLPAPGVDDSSTVEESDAVALFVDRARSQGVELVLDKETAQLVVSTCQRLDGMPLAIELAAARLRSLSVADLHSLLDQRFRLLTGGSRSALERQQTLRATVDWSYSLLNGPEQSVLRRLSVFSDGFDLEAARAVCGFGDIEIFEVTDVLGSLVDKSLVLAESAGSALRYRLLETIRQFAAERLIDLGGQEAATVAAAHCHYFLSVAEAAAPFLTGPDQAQWFPRLDADQSNLKRAIQHAVDDPDETVLVLRFAIALAYYWFTRSRRLEAFNLLAPVLERPEAGKHPYLFVEALDIGSAVARFINIKSAQRFGEQAVQIARQLDDERLLNLSLGVLAGAYTFAGTAEKAFPLARECVERARTIGDDRFLSEVLVGYLGCVVAIDPAQVDEVLAETMACAERSGNLPATVDLHNTAGIHALKNGDLLSARVHFEQALQAIETLGAVRTYASNNLGMLLRAEGDLDGAKSVFEDTLRLSRRSGDHFGLARSSLGLACLAADRGEWRRAAELHGVVEMFLGEMGQPWLFFYEPLRQDSMARVSAGLGEEEFQRLLFKGRELGLDEAIDLALGGIEHETHFEAK